MEEWMAVEYFHTVVWKILERRNKWVIDIDNTMQAWNLMDFEDSLKMHTSLGNQEQMTGLRQLFTNTKLDRINRSLK